MDAELNDLFYGSLLHDIGKVVQRADNVKRAHGPLGAEFLKDYTDNKSILRQLKYHMAAELKGANLDPDDLTYITYIADNISSGADRRTSPDVEENTYRNWDKWTNLCDIFNILDSSHEAINKETRYYKPVMLDDRDDIQFPRSLNSKFSEGSYSGILTRIKNTLKAIEFNEDYIPSILNLLEATLSYVPSTTNQDETNDISLYDHSKLTAAFALAIYQYFKAKGDRNFEQLFTNSKKFYQEKAFLLLSFDLSGIQDFIYTINDSGAAKTLRSRSFYLEILSRNIADNIVERLDLTKANIIYLGGGTAYLLLANTAETKATIEAVEKEINAFLMQEFGADLYVAFGYAEFSSDDINTDNAKYERSQDYPINNIYRQASESISAKKLHRYSADELRKLNQAGKKTGRECVVCHRVGKNVKKDEAEQICTFCKGLRDFSNRIQRNDFYLINEEESALPLGFNQYLHAITAADIPAVESGNIYARNKFYSGTNQARCLWVAYYSDNQLYDEYAKNSLGIDRLAVMRCDVDDLGMAFISGFKGKYNTFSRSATFSRNMVLFFNYHINKLMAENDIHGSIIYSGGDDVFVVGEWQDMIKFAKLLRQDFIKFTNGKLRLSTGIGLYPAKTPVSVMAKHTGKLEDIAKANGKDSIALFDEKYTYKWDHFINEILNEKYQLVEDFFTDFSNDERYGKAFIYNLINLIRASFTETKTGKRGEYKTMSWARWAYYLSRMEPEEDEAKEKFRKFTGKIHKYFLDSQEVQELELALMLYVYRIRE